MLVEIILMIVVGIQVNKLVTQKGLPKGWLAIVLAIPVAGFTMAFIAGFVLGVSGADQGIATLATLPFAYVAEGLASWGAIVLVKSQPDGAVPQYPPAPAPYVPGAMPYPQAPAAVEPVVAAAPEPSVAAVPVAPVAPAAPRAAGFCSECGANVWLTADGGCSAGHDASRVSNPYQV